MKMVYLAAAIVGALAVLAPDTSEAQRGKSGGGKEARRAACKAEAKLVFGRGKADRETRREWQRAHRKACMQKGRSA
jgi:hypothetical protein